MTLSKSVSAVNFFTNRSPTSWTIGANRFAHGLRPAPRTETTDMLDPEFKRRIRRLRTRAKLRGIGVLTTRRAISADNFGGVMLTDLAANAVVAGPRFDLSIAEAEAHVDAVIADMESARVR